VADNTTILGQNFVKLPTGTTAERPGSPAGGYLRANTTTGYIEYYDPTTTAWIGIGAFSASGGSVTQSGSFTYHTFTSSGTFTVTAGAKSVDYMCVAGGGGGGSEQGAGGGAGGLIDSTFTATTGTYSVVVGAGGPVAPRIPTTGSNGVNSSVFGQTSIGGGAGAGDDYNGLSGGSGGGASDYPGSGGAGTAGQGNRGGNTSQDGSGGAGGGGSGAAGGDSGSGSTEAEHRGGTGINWKSLGTLYAGGGSGCFKANSNQVPGGAGGGGDGGGSPTNGTANRGGGGGGGKSTGANGGSGVVIIRYLS
jgi:hypothetical protein